MTAEQWPTWQPIETAPRDGTYVLIGWTGVRCALRAKWKQNCDNLRRGGPGWEIYESEDPFYSLVYFDEDGDGPTHWMPLPPAPETTR